LVSLCNLNLIVVCFCVYMHIWLHGLAPKHVFQETTVLKKSKHGLIMNALEWCISFLGGV